MTESSPQNCSTVTVAVNTLLVSLTLRFIAAHHHSRVEGGQGRCWGGGVEFSASTGHLVACRDRGQVLCDLLFSMSKKVVGPSLAITSRRNMNITHFPFAMGQRGGSRAMACCTRCVWNWGRKSTQKILPSLSFCADKILAKRWSLLRNHQHLNTFRMLKTDGPSSRATTGAAGVTAGVAGGGRGL